MAAGEFPADLAGVLLNCVPCEFSARVVSLLSD